MKREGEDIRANSDFSQIHQQRLPVMPPALMTSAYLKWITSACANERCEILKHRETGIRSADSSTSEGFHKLYVWN